MAFLPNTQDQTQQQGQQNQVPSIPQIPTLQGTSGPSAGAGSGAQSGTTNTASPGAAPSSPWQNITTYLNANASQAGNVANTIAGNLQNQYNATNQAIGQTQQNFGQQIQNATTPYNQDQANQAAQNPSQFVQNPDNVAAFQKMWNANYTGPQNFSGTSDYSNLENQVQQAQKQASLVNQGTAGLQTLLQPIEAQGGKTPSQGVTALDSILLQENPENFTKLSAAAQPFAGLTDYLASTQKGLDTAAQQAANQTAQTQQTIQNQFTGPGGVVPSFSNRLNQELADAAKTQATKGNLLNDVTSGIQGNMIGSLNPAQLAALGLAPQQATDIQSAYDALSSVYGNAPSMASFYTPSQMTGAPTLAQVASPQDYLDAQALSSLIGSNVNLPIDQSTASQAGTYQPVSSNASFNPKQASNALLSELYGDFFNTSAPQTLSPHDLAGLNYLTSVAPSQQPGQMDYRTPQQVAAANAVESLEKYLS